MAFCTNCGASLQGSFCTNCGQAVASGSPAGATPPPGAAQPSPAPRKKTSPLVWILGIVIGLVLLFGVLLAAGGFFVLHKARQAGIDPGLLGRSPSVAVGRMLTAMNPDAELVSVDERAKRVTIRQKSTGKVITMELADLENGKMSFDVEGEGSMTVGGEAKLPDWVPAYPNSKPQAALAGQSHDRDGGIVHFTTKDAVEDVLAFYERALKESGFKINLQATGDAAAGGGLLAAQHDDGRTVTIMTSGENGGTNVNVTYGSKQR
jgi:hypothetical protein